MNAITVCNLVATAVTLLARRVLKPADLPAFELELDNELRRLTDRPTAAEEARRAAIIARGNALRMGILVNSLAGGWTYSSGAGRPTATNFADVERAVDDAEREAAAQQASWGNHARG